jgi:dipeptidase
VKRKRIVAAGVSLAIALIIFGTGIIQNSKHKLEELALSDLPKNCTVIVVGKEASTDGSVITSQTADCGICDWTWHYVPAADHSPGSTRKIYVIDQMLTVPPAAGTKWEMIKENETGLEIPQVPHTYAYFHSVFGYMNDQQLSIAESTISGLRREMNNTTPTPKMNITMLTLLAMERCKTAREAIKLMGSLAEQHGYGHVDTGEVLAVGDPNEVWFFEILPVGPLWTPESGKPGALWCAARVPDDHVSTCPNASRIGEIDLENPDYFMASPNVISYAVDKGYYDPTNGEPFNWKKAYTTSRASAISSRGWNARLWRFLDLVAPSKKFSPDTPNVDLPFSVKPDRKLSAADVMLLTRDKYEDSPFDLRYTLQAGPFSNPNYLTRPYSYDEKQYNTKRFISDNRAEYVTVTQSRNWLPNPIGGIVWLAFGAQDTSCYMPLYIGVDRIPHSFTIGDHWELNRESARWAFDYVDFHTQVAYNLAIQDVREAQEKWEGAAMAQVPSIDKTARELYEKDPAQATEFLTDYCMTHADNVVDFWWELGDRLLVKYNKVFIYDTETREKKTIKYPNWWLKKIIEYDKLGHREK